MWLPPQVVVLRAAPAGFSFDDSGVDPVVRNRTNAIAFIGYVVESDLVEDTIVRPGGGVVVTRRDNVVDLVTCQFEPDFDPSVDTPVIAYLPGFRRLDSGRLDQTCSAVLSAVEAG
jgi:hypothetical protein